MKKRGLFAAFLLYAIVGPSSAQVGGYYEFIPYYNNNPFLFCTIGVPGDCWSPVNPATGTYTVTNPYCFNPYSASLYARVCPQGLSGGTSGAQATPSSAAHSTTQSAN